MAKVGLLGRICGLITPAVTCFTFCNALFTQNLVPRGFRKQDDEYMLLGYGVDLVLQLRSFEGIYLLYILRNLCPALDRSLDAVQSTRNTNG